MDSTPTNQMPSCSGSQKSDVVKLQDDLMRAICQALCVPKALVGQAGTALTKTYVPAGFIRLAGGKLVPRCSTTKEKRTTA